MTHRDAEEFGSAPNEPHDPQGRPVKSKTYILDITGVCIEEDEIEDTTIHICRNGEWCEIPWDKDDIVEVEESDNEA